MKLVKARVRGYRCFAQPVEIDIGSFTAVLGRNDAGKSSFMEALAIFFEEGNLDSGDVCVYGEDKADVEITCEFENPPTELVIDADHPTTLHAEHLLNERGNLEITKIYDGELKTPKLKCTYVRAIHPSAQGYSDLLLLKNKDLKKRADDLGVDLSDVQKNINTELRRAIWRHGGQLAMSSRLIPVDEESAKKIWEQLKGYMPIFALFKVDRPSTDQDAEAQDPIKVAVSAALKSQEQLLEEIRKTVEESVLEVARQTLEKLAEIDPTLAQELRPSVPRPNWSSAFKIALNDEFGIPVNKRGSGVRRLILMNFFRAQAEQRQLISPAQGIIYAIEEPETSQHPFNQKLLTKAFFELAEHPGCQVIITTHNPALARSLPTKCLRLLRLAENRRREVLSNSDDVIRLACQELGVLPDNSVKAFIGVEGTNDVNFLRELSAVLSAVENDIPNLAEAEDKGLVIFIPGGGSNLQSWLNRFQAIGRPEFHLFDRDHEPPQRPKYSDAADLINARPNCLALHTDCREVENYIHPGAIQEEWPHLNFQDAGPFSDVPTRLTQIRITADGQNFAALSCKAQQAAIAGMKRTLNSIVVKRMSAARLSETDPNNTIRTFLRRIGQALSA
jgi:energy-coupling factor transporter ATP-binding protein EcfA2